MMRWCGALAVLLMTLSTAFGLRCYTCTAAEPGTCLDIKTCPIIFNRCYTLKVDGYYKMVSKGCQISMACGGAMSCCDGDLCNSAKHIGPSFILLVVSSAIITLFL
ncbi:lymphocyte antigen 6S-like [Polymixia lowei]